MPDHVIIAERYGAVLADAGVPCVTVRFDGFANREEFKRLMEAGLTYYIAHSTPGRDWGWVGDTRQMAAIPQEVQDWLTYDWNPRAYAAGIREISIVVSENIFGQLATQHYAQSTLAERDEYALIPVYYSTPEEAKQGAAARCAALWTVEQ